MQTADFAVLKISTAISNKPFFVRITDPAMSLDRIFGEAVTTLTNLGQPLEAQQLDQLYHSHQLFSNGKVIQKGDLFRDLSTKIQQVGDQHVHVAELDLVTSHSGGMPISYDQMVEIEHNLLRTRGQSIPGTVLKVGDEMQFTDHGFMDPQPCVVIRFAAKTKKLLIRVGCRDYRWINAAWVLPQGGSLV
jgi:hypothetical protein